jgi:hypothetical protein
MHLNATSCDASTSVEQQFPYLSSSKEVIHFAVQNEFHKFLRKSIFLKAVIYGHETS